MKFNKIFHRKSFTLLEIMIATVIIVIGVVTVVRCFSSGLYADESVEGKVIALAYAQEFLEIYKIAAYDSAALSTVSDISGSCRLKSCNVSIAYAQVGSISKSYIQQLTVRVYWSYRNQTNSVYLSTYVTPYTSTA